MTDADSERALVRHWDEIYGSRDIGSLSWFQPVHRLALEWIDDLVLDPDAPIVDVGAGASPLARDLLGRGHHDVTAVDWSSSALASAGGEPSGTGPRVRTVRADVLDRWVDGHRYALWHDRAVFHFLTEPASRATYRTRLREALCPGGYVLMGTFAPDGPDHCSGLPVARYGPGALSAEIGPGFRALRSAGETHVTPTGSQQSFTWLLMRREPAGAPTLRTDARS